MSGAQIVKDRTIRQRRAAKAHRSNVSPLDCRQSFENIIESL